MLDAGVLDSQLRSCNGREPDEGPDFDVIWTDRVRHRLAAQSATTLNSHGIRADTLDLGTQGDQEMGEVLHVGLAGSVAEDRGALGGGRRHQRVFSGGYAGLVEENVRAAKAVDAHLDHLAMSELRAELLESQK